jgi:arylsulfatase
MPSSYPNVVLIAADQMKWSALRMYSEIGIATPSLERLAAEGVRFEHAITPHPLCVPARVSMMTARYAHSTGCRRNQTPMPPGQLHAYRIWKELGYTTGLIGKNHCFDQPSDLELIDVRCELPHLQRPRRGTVGQTQGMEWVVPEDVIRASHETRLNMPEQSPAISYAVTEHALEGYSTNAITTQAEAFIERAAQGDIFGGSGGADDGGRRKPFALFVSYPDPHHPLEIHKKYADMVPPESLNLPPTRDGEFDAPDTPERNRVLYEILGLHHDSGEDIRNAIAVYLAMGRMIDDGVGRILDKLESLGLRDGTIVVFTSDHGDFAGEHNMLGKGGVFYDSLVRVPLVVSWPGGDVPQGAVDDSLVNIIDILPTVLQLGGVTDFMRPPDLREGDELPPAGPRVLSNNGSELVTSETLRRLQGKPLPTVTSAPPRAAAFSEYGTGGPPFTMEMLDRLPARNGFATVLASLLSREAEGRRKMVRTKSWKYVTDPDEGPVRREAGTSGARKGDELYDLVADPWELHNAARAPANAGVISEMRALLGDWMMETEDPDPVPLPVTIS